MVYGPSFTVMKSSPEKQLAAWLFARSMLNPQIQTQWTRATGMLPLRNSSMILLKSYAASHPQLAQAVALFDLAELQPKMASWRTVKYTLGDGLYSLFRLNIPAGDVPSVLEEIQETAEDLDK
jgi:multiple sugar transport system substrate-binding protein/sn-glycerol 3-phosphate transport system substrate-binding protein